jgi:hypothetical protein
MKLNFNRTYDLSPVSIWIYGILLLLILFSPLILGFIYIGFPDNVTLLQATNIEPIGFLSGLFHGFIIIISFIGSLFFDDITIYAIYNNGGWYNFGYIIGVYILYNSSVTTK